MPLLNRIAELEEQLAPQLQDRREVAHLDFSYLPVAQAWVEAVWDAALEPAGPRLPSPSRDEMLALARHPVFVCGAHRSGTTLLRDLLDSHPALSVLPFESDFYTGFGHAVEARPPGRRAAFAAQKWLRSLVNPMNQPPFWLLGRSCLEASPYVDLARAYIDACEIFGPQGSAPQPSWPLVSFALAYALQRRGAGGPPNPRMWLEKTPGSEQHLDRIWTEFPAAKVLHVVRRPEAVLASYKALLKRAGRPATAAAPAVRNLARSYRIALDLSRRAPAERYCLIRFEELAADRERVMARIAVFLGIELSPAVLEPTVAGMSATNNTAYSPDRAIGTASLSPLERELLALALGRQAGLLGYDGLAPGTWTALAARTLRRMMRGTSE